MWMDNKEETMIWLMPRNGDFPVAGSKWVGCIVVNLHDEMAWRCIMGHRYETVLMSERDYTETKLVHHWYWNPIPFAEAMAIVHMHQSLPNYSIAREVLRSRIEKYYQEKQ